MCVGCAFLDEQSDDSFVIIQQRTGDLLVVAAATAWAAYIVLTAAIPSDAGALEVQARAEINSHSRDAVGSTPRGNPRRRRTEPSLAPGFYGICWASSASVEVGRLDAARFIGRRLLRPGPRSASRRVPAARPGRDPRRRGVDRPVVGPIWAALLAAPVPLGEGLTARVGGGGALIFAGAALAATGSEPGRRGGGVP